MRLALIGFMGAGKSTVAKALAESLNQPLVELDGLIIQRSGLSSIREIFDLYGEKHFRDLESEALKTISQTGDMILSTGGGAVLRAENIECLKEKSCSICFLRTSFDVIVDRVKDLSERPLFNNLTSARELFEQRMPVYSTLADFEIDTSELDPSSVVSIIRAVIGE